MSNLKFAKTHNLVAFLEKPEESDGFEGIIDFLNASSIRYELTVNPTIYTSCIKQVSGLLLKAKIVNGTKVKIQALVKWEKGDPSTETSELERMGYENLTQKLTFYKAFFSPQWKFLIHTILQCLSAKTTKQKPRKTKKQNTEVSQPSDLTQPMVDETGNVEKITKLKERVKKLERRNKSRTSGLKRLRKVGRSAQVVSSDDEGLGAQEDASKQGRKITDIDADEEEVEAEKVFSTAEVTTASATTITIDELTLTQTLIEIKAAKSKVVTTAATTTTTAVTRPKV
ncbi:hypothetical protein Tco_0590025 [Tanacetum coccineum]